MNKVRWGVLSTAKIGTEQVIPAMQKGQYTAVTAISSRNLKKAKAEAEQQQQKIQLQQEKDQIGLRATETQIQGQMQMHQGT